RFGPWSRPRNCSVTPAPTARGKACGREFEDSGRDRPTFRDRCRRLETAALAAEGFGWWQRWHEWLGPDGSTAVWLPGNIALSSAAAGGSVHYRGGRRTR